MDIRRVVRMTGPGPSVVTSTVWATIIAAADDVDADLVVFDLMMLAHGWALKHWHFAPALTIDYATLTGAARVALGPQLPPLYTDDEALAADYAAAAAAIGDPVWRMPLWSGYESALGSDIADMTNDPDGWAQAGSVTAALFLKRFAPTCGAWAHLDVFAWNSKARPGWPVGGELQGVRAAYALLKQRFSVNG